MQKKNCAQLAVFYETMTAKDTEIERFQQRIAKLEAGTCEVVVCRAVVMPPAPTTTPLASTTTPLVPEEEWLMQLAGHLTGRAWQKRKLMRMEEKPTFFLRSSESLY